MAFTQQDLGLWYAFLAQSAGEAWYTSLEDRVERAYETGSPRVFPPREDLFSALRATPPDQVSCVILGQDPYHEEGQAHGLSFSVRKGVKIPPSLRNIYKELHEDLVLPIPNHGCLEAWAGQGVLLLNSTLTVYEGQANSHQKWGWDRFTSCILDQVERQPQPVAYLLWGRFAQKKAEECHLGLGACPRLVLKANHPSPLSASRGFFGSRPFSQVNAFLEEQGARPIDWSVS